jgi:hypothetical protein
VVIGRRFAWAHLPKTAGDATYCMLAAVPGLVQFADPLYTDDKHLPFFAREAGVAGKLLCMNIRRLPAWALSGAQHKAAHGVHPEYQPLPLENFEQITSRTDADDLLRWMTDHQRFRVDRWLRTEALEEDLIALLEELGECTSEARAGVLAVGRVNEGSYRHELQREFTDKQVKRLYALNPDWAAIERRVYGGLPID